MNNKKLLITGEMSDSPSVDSWLDQLGGALNKRQNLPSVKLFHDRFDLTGNHIDKTHYDTREDVQQGFPHNNDVFNKHMFKLLDYINTNQNDNN